MKTLFQILIFILLNHVTKAQMLVGMGGAISNKHTPFFQSEYGFTFGKSIYDDGEKRQKANSVYALLSVGYNSQIIALHAGRNIGALHPYLGYSYQVTNHYNKNAIQGGYKPDFGLSYYLGSMPLCFSLGRSGNTTLLSLLIYTVK